jgi:hypothetical protein
MPAPMGRSIRIFLVFVLLTLAPAVRAQTPATCGVVEIEGPTEAEVGTPLRFKAKIKDVNITGQEFKWITSSGTITTGQGTDEVTIDTAGLGGMVLTATVVLSKVPPGCAGAASITATVKPFTCGLAFDQYGDLEFENEKARLDNFAIQLMNEPLSTGYILMSAGQTTFQNETAERLARAKSYLVDVREIDRNRIVTVDCRFSQDLTITLRIAPAGAGAPPCTDLELPFSEVKFTKPRPKSHGKH